MMNAKNPTPLPTLPDGTPVVELPQVEAMQPNRSSWLNKLKFTVALFLQLLLRGKLRLFAPLWAQSRHETASFESYGFNDRRNPWGMRPSQQRNRYWSSEHGGFAVYASYWMAISDRLDWDRANGVLALPGTKYVGSFPFERWLGSAYTVTEALQYRNSWVTLIDHGWNNLRSWWSKAKWFAFLLGALAVVLLFMRIRRGLRRGR